MFWEKPAPRWQKRLAVVLDLILPLLFTLSVHALFPISQGLIFSLFIFFILTIPFLNAFSLKKWGRSFGGLLLGLKVLKSTGENLSFKEALLYVTALRTRTTNVVRRKKGWLRLVAGLFLGTLLLPALPWESLVPYAGELIRSETGWLAFEHPQGDFYAFFPTKPNENVTEIKHPSVSDPLAFYEYKSSPGGGKTYVISYIDFPSRWSLLGSRRILDGALELVMGWDGSAQLVSRNGLVHQGYPALQVSYLKPSGELVSARLIRVGNRLYKIAATLPQTTPVETSFFDTFTVEKK